MIQQFTATRKSDKKELPWLSDFINKNSDLDFYYTEDNNRIFITDVNSLKDLLKISSNIYIKKEKGNFTGIILIWKSSGDVNRYYVKLLAKDYQTAKDLLTVLTWNFGKDLYVKIRKDSKFVNAFKEKGFRFSGGRGISILLHREATNYQKFRRKEEE